MKITVALLHKLRDLAEGKTLPSSSLSPSLFNALREENCIVVHYQGSRRTVRAVSPEQISFFARHYLEINDIQAYLEALKRQDDSRATWTELTGNSKERNSRGWKGFPLAVLEPMTVTYNDKPLNLSPVEGMALIVNDFKKLSIPENITVVGIENGENFMQLEQQRAFFERYVDVHRTLFVSRYPQNGDIARWLAGKPNRYIHFGDLDIAGVSIFQNEFYKKLGNRASFLTPLDYETRIQRGSFKRYDIQFKEYGVLTALDPDVQPVLDCIYKYHKGYDQEGFILKSFIE